MHMEVDGGASHTLAGLPKDGFGRLMQLFSHYCVQVSSVWKPFESTAWWLCGSTRTETV